MEQQLLKEIHNDNTEKVMEILQNPINLNVYDKKGQTPLHLALENQNMNILNALISCPTVKTPINFNILDEKRGLTCLAYAVDLNYIEGVQKILTTTADPNFKMENGQTAMHLAASNNNVNCLKLLAKYGADINMNSDEGTPLHLAVKNICNEAALHLIQKKKVQLLEVDAKGNTVFHEAVVQGFGDIILQIFNRLEFLLKENQKDYVVQLINHKNNDGNTVFHLASLNQRETVYQLLEQKAEEFGLDKGLKNNMGLSAAQIKEQIEMKEKQQKEEIQQRKIKQQEVYKEKMQTRKVEKQEEKQKIIQETIKEINQEKRKKKIDQTYQKLAPYLFILVMISVMVMLYFKFKKEAYERQENFID